MPEGWVQEREINFEGDGVLKTKHEISYVKGTVMNKVTVEGTGFNADSPVLNDGLSVFLPSTEMSYPLEDGVRSHTLLVSTCATTTIRLSNDFDFRLILIFCIIYSDIDAVTAIYLVEPFLFPVPPVIFM